MTSARIPRTRGTTRVPERAWEALRLQQDEHLTYPEIANRMGVNSRMVDTWLRAIRESRRDAANVRRSA